MDLSLAGIKDQLMRSMVTQAFIDDTGNLSYMTLVPKFKTAGLPQTELNGLELGGFWADTYPCSQPNATSTSRGSTPANNPGTTPAVSRAGVVSWTDISQPNAMIACSNRKINGVACHLVTMEEWAALAYLTWMYDRDMRGNTDWGKDHRDANSWENYGIEDPLTSSYADGYSKDMARVLTGTGPSTWRLFGQHIWGLVGNVWEWLDFVIEDGLWTAPDGKKHCIAPPGGAAAILGTELTDDPSIITIPFSYDPDYVGPELPSQGVIQLRNEQISYTGKTGAGLIDGTLTGCTRSANGSPIAAHPSGRRFTTVDTRFNYSPTTTGDYGAYGAAKLSAMATSESLRKLAIPEVVSSSGNSQYGNMHAYYWRTYGPRAALRGGYFTSGSNGGVGALILYLLPSYADLSTGFRAAMDL